MKSLLPILCVALFGPHFSLHAQSRETPSAVEEIYLFRSVRERTTEGQTDFCKAAPFPTTVENYYSLWSISGNEATGQVTNAKGQRIGDLHNCVAVKPDGTQEVFAVGAINGVAFKGVGDQRFAQQTPVVRSLVNRFLLEGLPSPYVAGVLSSNTVRLTPADSQGYVVSSVAVVRLWKRQP